MNAPAVPPLEPFENGRDTKGRFTKGNAGGPGNPSAKRAVAYRNALAKAVTAKDIRDVVKKLVELAKGGDTVAAKIILDRTLGAVTTPLNIQGISGGGPTGTVVLFLPDNGRGDSNPQEQQDEPASIDGE